MASTQRGSDYSKPQLCNKCCTKMKKSEPILTHISVIDTRETTVKQNKVQYSGEQNVCLSCNLNKQIKIKPVFCFFFWVKTYTLGGNNTIDAIQIIT